MSIIMWYMRQCKHLSPNPTQPFTVTPIGSYTRSGCGGDVVYPPATVCGASIVVEASVKRRIRLRGLSSELEGKVWESDSLLRAGRLETLEVVLDDSSVSRRHAEIRCNENGW